MKSQKPVFHRSSADCQRIVHREKVAKLTTPATGVFTVLDQFPLNPGMNKTFPWLSNEAKGWESYRINRMRFIWVPTSGTSVAGNIIMGPDYDAADAAPAGETFMSAYSDTEEGNVWCRFDTELSRDLLNGESRRKYIRDGPLADNLDIKTYDSGNFFVCSTDDAAANSGKLWVEYDIDLYNPQVPAGGFQAVGVVAGGGTLSAAAPFGSAPVASGPVGITHTSGNNMNITGVQVGQEIAVSFGITGTFISTISLTAGTGLTLKTSVGAAINAAQTVALEMETYIVTAPNPVIGTTVAATTITASKAVVSVVAPVASF